MGDNVSIISNGWQFAAFCVVLIFQAFNAWLAFKAKTSISAVQKDVQLNTQLTGETAKLSSQATELSRMVLERSGETDRAINEMVRRQDSREGDK